MADGARLESVYTSKTYRGFESHLFRMFPDHPSSKKPRLPLSRTERHSPEKRNETSWQNVHQWYDQCVGKEGHYYHQHVVLPGVMQLLQLQPGDSLIDVCCGQGILERWLPQECNYYGLDGAKDLVKAAQAQKVHHDAIFQVADARHFRFAKNDFSHAACILALQNIDDPFSVFKCVKKHLKPGGAFVIVMNHPCFRIPRQSHWDIDTEKGHQSRRLDRYLSPLQIPIDMNPSKGESHTFSFHFPLSYYVESLFKAGFVVEEMREWISPKESTGKHARMENRARREFPLFLAIRARSQATDNTR